MAIDELRQSYLRAYAKHTNRHVILYATSWMQKQSQQPDINSITDEDMQGFMEVMYGAKSKHLDLILHSPGGRAESAEALVKYMRSRFDHIRVVVPMAAMSAASMVSCAADEIVMGKHSSLGPIDPQMIMRTGVGVQAVPAQAIRDQFATAQKECQDPTKVNAWIPMLSQYGPALLTQCENAQMLSEELVKEWLTQYMLKDEPDKEVRAREIAGKLANHNDHKSHGRHLFRDVVKGYGLTVTELEEDQTLQDLTLSIYHAATLTFSTTHVVKIIESAEGRRFLKQEVPAGAMLMQPRPGVPLFPLGQQPPSEPPPTGTQ